MNRVILRKIMHWGIAICASVALPSRADDLFVKDGTFTFLGSRNINFAAAPYVPWTVTTNGTKAHQVFLSIGGTGAQCFEFWTQASPQTQYMDTEIALGMSGLNRLDDDGGGGLYSKARIWLGSDQGVYLNFKALSTLYNNQNFNWGYRRWDMASPGQCEDVNTSFYSIGGGYPEKFLKRH